MFTFGLTFRRQCSADSAGRTDSNAAAARLLSGRQGTPHVQPVATVGGPSRWSRPTHKGKSWPTAETPSDRPPLDLPDDVYPFDERGSHRRTGLVPLGVGEAQPASEHARRLSWGHRLTMPSNMVSPLDRR
jgi:hypothetical protein